jgi:hypothetical protein
VIPKQFKDFLKQLIALPATRTAIGLLSLLLVLIGWSISSPVGSSPDDDYHLASAYCGQGIRKGLCEHGSTQRERRVPSGVVHAHDCYRDPVKSAECLDTEKVLENPTLGYFTPNTSGVYPKLFYLSSSFLATTNVARSVALMRLLNVFIVFSIFTFTYLTVSQRLRKALLLSWCLTSVPLGLFIMASNNPSSWSTAAISVFWINVVSFFQINTRRGKFLSAWGVLPSAIVALGARPDSGAFLGVGLVFSLVFCWPLFNRTVRKATMAAAVILVAILLLLTRLGIRSTVIQDGLTDTSYDRPIQGVLQYNLENITNLIFGNFGLTGTRSQLGNLGWFNTPIPPTASFLLTIVFITYAIYLYSQSQTRGKLSLILLSGILVALPLRVLQVDRLQVGSFVQPRYLLPLLFLIIGFGVMFAERVTFPRDLQIFAVVTLTLSHSLCLHACIRRYISNFSYGYGTHFFDLNSHSLWWSNFGPSPTLVWAIGSIAFGVFSLLAVFDLNRDRSLLHQKVREVIS